MTTPIATEVRARKTGGIRRKRRTFAEDLGSDLVEFAVDQGTKSAGILGELSTEERAAYRADPARFASEVLGVKLWEKQVEILEAVRDSIRVAVRSGHKVSKSHTAAVVALWFYCCFDDARVVLTAVTGRQVDGIIWREIRRLVRNAKRPIDGDLHDLARSGLKSDDFREIVGFTAREAEAVAGVSGANLLYIVDEASGVDAEIFDAIEGNSAGGAKLVMISNPTRTIGRFFEAFHTKKDFYRCVHVSSTETPNARTGRNIIPGLAGREWIDRMREEWGEDSPFYKVRVLGEFVMNEEGRIIHLDMIFEAKEAWADADDDGVLHLGVDPAGPGTAGDESAFAVRRGKKILQVTTKRGLSEDRIVAEVLDIIGAFRKKREPTPVVAIDREGPIGSSVYGLLRSQVRTCEANGQPVPFEVIAVRSSDRAHRRPEIWDRVRDELWGNLAQWLREGGAIPEDPKLELELHAPSWTTHVSGRLKATPKDEIRQMLEGRSPDRADAVALSVWSSAWLEREDSDEPAPQPTQHDPYREPQARGIDPYAALDTWGRR